MASRYNQGVVLLAGLVLAVTLYVYWPVRHYDFVDYDDNSYITENPDVSRGLTWWGIEWALVDQHCSNWHPVTWLSHMIDCQWFGLNAGPAHFENVLFHCANVALLLLFLNATTDRPWRNLFVAALFALHPLRVESVAWISERKDVLSGFFFLLTIWCYVRHRMKTAGESPGKDRLTLFYKLSLVFFALGLMSKPMLVTLPIILLLIDYWPLQCLSLSSFRRLLIEKSPFFLLSICVGIITLYSQHAGGGWVDLHESFFIRLQKIVVGYAAYIEKLLWPQNLSFLYLRPQQVSSADFLRAGAILLGVTAIALMNARRRPALLVGWLWFLVMLLPVSLFDLGHQSIADRYTYLPGIGFYIALTWAVVDLGDRVSWVRLRYALNVIVAIVVLWLCAMLTQRQVGYWRNTETLMEHAIVIDPDNYVARHNLRIYRMEKAHPELKKKREQPVSAP